MVNLKSGEMINVVGKSKKHSLEGKSSFGGTANNMATCPKGWEPLV